MNMARWAERYVERGLVLTWVPSGQKGPRHTGWQRPENAIRTAEEARHHWTRNPWQGMAALLAASGLVSLDVDDADATRTVLAAFDIDLAALVAPTIEGRPGRCRMLFRDPGGLRHRSVTWPEQDNLQRRRVLFELRAGAIADTLPPSIHPDTGRPYRWTVPPREGFPDLPAALLALWRDWPATEARALAVCPWAPIPKPRPAWKATPRPAGESVITAFNAAHDIGTLLEAAGYVRKGNRFARAESSHAAGLVLLGERVYCHHAGDVLGDGKAHDAFDVWCQLEHGGDFRRAVRSAADLLGLQSRRAA